MSTSVPTLYASFAKIVSSYQEQYPAADDHAGPSSSTASTSQLDAPVRRDAVLDEEGGMLAALMGSLEETIRSKTSSGAFEPTSDDQISEEEREALLLEHRTWQLVRTIFDNRLHRSDPDFAADSAEQHLRENPYVAPEELVQCMVNEDDELSLYATLVEHLQSRPLLTSPPPLEARHGYLPSTLRRAKASLLSAKTNGSAASHLPTPPSTPSLDPDFTLRDPHGPGLAGEDQTYQNPLLETLWDLVRHGELDQAVRVCEEGGESWRAGSLLGGRRWSMGGMTKDSMGVTPLEGNRTRALWKRACRAIAKNPLLSPAERHLYAALVSDLPTLLPACETWEDHLWAQIQARMEARIEDRWKALGGFWCGEDGLLGEDREESGVPGGLDEVFASLNQVPKEDVISATRNPYYVAQRMLILNRLPNLLLQFADRLPTLADSISPPLIGSLVRFFAHLVLLLRSLSQPVPDDAANAILQAYLVVLEREGEAKLVAMYAACLREGGGEESYARFLRGLDVELGKEGKMEALERARSNGLDVGAIARETVRGIFEEAFSVMPALSEDLPDITNFSPHLGLIHTALIRSLEWLLLLPSTLPSALTKSNDLLRHFLTQGNAAAAGALLRTLPPALTEQVSEADDEQLGWQAAEHEQYKMLFGVFAGYERVEEVRSRKPKETGTKVEWFNWRKNLASSIDKVRLATLHLLTGSFLHLPLEPSAFPHRTAELARIRQIFVPDLILRLHNLLYQHKDLFPEMLGGCMELVKIVADEDNGVYAEFLAGPGRRDGGEAGAGRLGVYLERIREVGVEMVSRKSA